MNLKKTEFLYFIMGMLLGFPLVYPSTPYYWLAFFVFGVGVMFYIKNLKPRTMFLVLLAMMVSTLSSLYGVSVGNYPIDPFRVIFTTVFFAFFIFGELIPNKTKLLLGYVFSLNIVSIAVILAAMIFWPFKSGLLFFSLPELRLWGDPWFPDWPNFLAFMLSLTFIFNILVYKNNIMGLLNISAALLTTSRTPLIAIAIVIFIYVVVKNKSIASFALKFVVLTVAAALISYVTGFVSEEFINRLFIFSDRGTIYGFALSMIVESPIIGHGAVLMDNSVGLEKFASFHNSYLDILVRHGLLGFLVFLLLIWPKKTIKGANKNAYWALIAFFIIGALFQNFIKHPHLLMILSIIIATRGVLK